MAEENSAAQALDVPTEAPESPPITQPMEVPEPPSESLKTSSSASRRVRARLARRMTAQRSTLNPVLGKSLVVYTEKDGKWVAVEKVEDTAEKLGPVAEAVVSGAEKVVGKVVDAVVPDKDEGED